MWTLDGTGTVRRRNKTIVTPKMAMESFRFSFLNSEENQDVNFDAILGELCELETQLNTTQTELSRSLGGYPAEMVNEHQPHEKKDGGGGGGGGSGGGGSDMIQAELDALAAEITQGLGYRNNVHVYNGQTVDTTYDTGETDSAFSDNASLPSSESFTSMVTVSSSADTTSSSSGDTCSTSSAMSAATLQGEEEQRARLKAEKIRIALEKIKEAKIRKLFVRAFAKDGSSKSILVDEKMAVGQVASVLADKNHMKLNTNLTVIEHMPDLLMERILEDHDSLVENMVMWTRDSKNKVLFEERAEKFDLFKHPEKYLLIGTSSERGVSLGPSQQERLIQEFFSSSGVKVPEVEGPLYLKSDGKKAWKKYFFVLRASGLYYNPKGKISKSPKDLACLVQFDFVEPYHGLGWKKKYHAPTDYCFALKHPQIQRKNSKYIRYLCAESKTTMDQWIMGVRLAKLGKQLLHNYERAQHEISMWDLRDISSPSSQRTSTNIPDQLCLNNVGNLQDSRMSVPEPGSRHSIVTVKNASLVRNSGPDCDNPNEVVGIDVVPMPQRKGSVGGLSGGDPSPQPKTPVKRVSFSNTHCIINADSREEMVHLRHRDSITSASTDSSEDSASSGEGKHCQGGTRGKLRPKLPVTTETTRQLSEMFQISMDTCSVQSNDSAFSDDRKSYLEKRRSSSSSTSSDKMRMHSESDRTSKTESIKEQRMSSTRSSGPMSPLSPPLQRQSSEPTYQQLTYQQPKAAVMQQAPVPPPQEKAMPPPPPPPNAAVHPPHPVPSNTMPQPIPVKSPPPPPPQMQKGQGSVPPPPPGHMKGHGSMPPPPPPMQNQGSVPQPPVMPPAPTIPAPASPVPTGIKRPGSTPPQNGRVPPPPPPQGRGPPPPPPVKTTQILQPQKQNPISPTQAQRPPNTAMSPGQVPRPPNSAMSPGQAQRPPNSAMSPGQAPRPPNSAMSPGQAQRPPNSAMSPPPPPVTGMQKFTGPFSPQLSRVERQMNGSAGPPTRSPMSPGTPPGGPPTTAPKPKPPPLSPVGNQNLGTKSPRNSPTVLSPPPPNGMMPKADSPSAMDKGAGIPMPPPMPLLQTLPTQLISQRISHIKHPSTGTPMSQSVKQGPNQQQTVLQKNRVTTNGGMHEDHDSASVQYMTELSKRSHNHPPQFGHNMAHGNHTAECVSMPNQSIGGANHRRSASAGGNVMKPPGPPVAQKPDSKKANPPPPPKRSEHTRLSSDQARQLRLQQQKQQQQQQQQQQQSGERVQQWLILYTRTVKVLWILMSFLHHLLSFWKDCLPNSRSSREHCKLARNLVLHHRPRKETKILT
ncbi:ras-associated and pleckstrin homology domains-containing protein 1-like isoform X2 [Haliotis rubra]|uniref:ras-associated and pleckstrin homology domains-containing protein 1-like isoform X2 n=1 Tax=Haliotis rubra TaxID=36100 RepID=UPI001EE5C26E|nr:ras-associated and pleckstrin homology domains-containing protein 1-like isoform X2 [Haliotis rubra]